MELSVRVLARETSGQKLRAIFELQVVIRIASGCAQMGSSNKDSEDRDLFTGESLLWRRISLFLSSRRDPEMKTEGTA